MKKSIIILLMLTITCASTPVINLEKVWETEPVFKIPESVNYDPVRNVLYVSNINGNPTDKDGNGFISKVGLDGNVIELEWITGLNAPKGAAIFQNKLYVSDIDQLVEIDIVSGEILNKYTVPEAVFLNDVVVDSYGDVYISDTAGEYTVYWFSEGQVQAFLMEEVEKPNGLYIKGNTLIVGSNGKIKGVNLNDKNVITLFDVGSSIDGLKETAGGQFIFSDWQGKTSMINQAGKVSVLLNTTEKNINSADLEYIKKQNLLIIPTFYNNRLVAYRILR